MKATATTDRPARHRGRPPGRTRGEPYSQRYAAGELEAFRVAAELAGLSMSAWMRLHLRAVAIRELSAAGKPIPFLEAP